MQDEYQKRSTTEYGANVASSGFNSAVIQYMARELMLVTPPSIQEAVRKQALHLQRQDGSFSVVSRTQMPAELASRGCHAWIDASGEFTAPFYARSLYSPDSLFPVIVTHHSISYHHLATQVFLPLIMLETFDFDCFVCSSESAKQQVKTLMAAVTEEVKHQFGAERQYNGTLEVIPFGVDTNRYRLRDKAAVRKTLGIKKDAFVILYVGRISPIDKGDIFPFLGMIKDLARDVHPQPLRVIIAGGILSSYGPLLKEYIRSAGIGKEVILMHRVPDSDLPDLYSAADIFLALSDNIQECLGVAAIEALASGLPQIVPDWSGYRDTVQEGVTGYRIPTYWRGCDDDICKMSTFSPTMWSWSHYNLAQTVAIDLRILRERILDLARNREKRAEMAVQSVARARANYDWAVIMHRYEKVVEERAIAAGLSVRPRITRRPPFVPSFFAATKQFATSILHDNTHISRGEIRIRAPQEDPRYSNFFGDMESSIPNAPVDLMVQLPVSGTFGAFRAAVSETALCSAVQAERLILWLIKYGYLSVSPA